MKKITLSFLFLMTLSIFTFGQENIEEIYKETVERPVISGCEKMESKEEKKICTDRKMYTYIYSQLRYPHEARKNGIQGSVEVSFIVNTEGKIDSVKILKDIGGGCGEIVKKTIQGLNELEWIPGKRGDKNTNVEFNFPVKFRLP